MWKLIVRASCFLLIQVAIGLFLIPSGIPDRPAHYLAAMEDKINLLAAPGQDRLIFVGGSTTAFGIDSGMFEERLHRKTINIGLHGGLGLDIYLTIVERNVRPGDTVILIPEWGMIRGRLQVVPAIVPVLLRAHPTSVRYMGGNLPAVKRIADHLALSELAYWTQQGARTRWTQYPLPDLFGNLQLEQTERNGRVYHRDSFNQAGDMVGHHGIPSREKQIALHLVRFRQAIEENNRKREVGDLPPGLAGIDLVVDRIHRFSHACEHKGAQVLVSYPPGMREYYEMLGEGVEDLQEQFERRLDLPLVSTPADNTFPRDCFFDNLGHMTERGKIARSRRLVVKLSEQLDRMAAQSPQHDYQ